MADRFVKKSELLELSVNTYSSSHIINAPDSSALVRMDLSSDGTVTIPSNATVELQIGTKVFFRQVGIGKITFSPASGVTLTAIGGRVRTIGQYAMAAIVKESSDVWALTGDLE